MYVYGVLFCSDEDVDRNEAIEADKPQEEVRQEPYSLPHGFQWDTLDISKPMVVRNKLCSVQC